MKAESLRTVKEQVERCWYAIYTKPRFEKMVDYGLNKKGLISYLPIHTVKRVWSDRIKKVLVPLFPSYVFVYANPMERYRAIQTHGALKVISFNGQPIRIPAGQIENVKKMLMFECSPEPFQYFNFGDEVEVLYGPLKGVKGYFIEHRGKQRLIVSIHDIQQSLAIEMERNNVKKANGLHE